MRFERHVGIAALFSVFLVSTPLAAVAPTSSKPPPAKVAPKTRGAPPTKAGLDVFEKTIRPILVRHCYECHSGDPKKTKGGFALDTKARLLQGGQSGAAIVPGNPDESLLIEAIRYEGLEMPPKEQLPEETIAELVEWVRMGAPDPRIVAPRPGKVNLTDARRWWSFQKPKATTPEVVDASWPRTDIDRFVLARLEKSHLKPAADADRVTLIRRATFDLIGLPPTPEEVDAFVRDESTNAFGSVVDRLLESPQFGERWGRHWLDTARYGESTGKERNVALKYAWRYRDYVIDSFNGDKPYDRFLQEQLAGDLVPAESAGERNMLLVATGFLALGTKSLNERNPEQFKMNVVDDQIDAVMRGMLGLTVACARCHDHKFDPIPTADYYSLAGIFHSTETLDGVQPPKKMDKQFVNNRRLLELADHGKAKSNPKEVREEKAREQEVRRVEAQLTALRGELKRLTDMRKEQGQPKRQGEPAIKVARKRGGPPAFKGQGKQIREQIKKLEDHLAALGDGPEPTGELAMGVRDASLPANCHILNRGELKDEGPEVPRGGLKVLPSPDLARINPTHSGRLELARWVASKENPLVARVMVNRVWQHLFGKGLVETTDNFGALGDAPSHPELLDSLAVEFMTNHHWSVKQLIRSIMNSHVYQLSSEHSEKNYSVDASNRLLWRMDRRRLEAEAIRDAVLAASGQLDLKRPVGSPVMELDDGNIGKAKDLNKFETAGVRSVYLPIIRDRLPETLKPFDVADPSLIVGSRDVTNVPTQALFMMNAPFVAGCAQRMAQRLLDTKREDNQKIVLAYRWALGREPTDYETLAIINYLKDYRKTLETAKGKGNPQVAAWTSVCQMLFSTAEFRYLY